MTKSFKIFLAIILSAFAVYLSIQTGMTIVIGYTTVAVIIVLPLSIDSIVNPNKNTSW